MATKYAGVSPDPKAIIKRADDLKANRENWEALWEEIAHYVLPTKSGFIRDPIKGSHRTDGIFDSTAPTALGNLASGLHGALTAPSGR